MRSYPRRFQELHQRYKRRDNRIKLVEAEEPDRDTRKEADTMVLEV